nr:unnamed protein product [Spirometra erinaceieuropaei]
MPKAIPLKVSQTILPLMMNPGEMPKTSRAVESEPEERTLTAKKKRKAAPQANNPSEIAEILDTIQSPY